MNKELKDLASIARAQCWTVEPTANDHLRWTSPSGVTSTISGTTPSSARSLSNLKADLKRAGLILDRQAWRRYEKELQQIMRDLAIPHTPGPREIAAIIEVAASEDPDSTCQWHTPPREWKDPVFAAMHRQKCPNKPDPDSQEDPDVKRDMHNPPDREKLKCPEGCPDWWAWVSQPHLLESHLKTEHGLGQCPYCQQTFKIRNGGLGKHIDRCPARPEVKPAPREPEVLPVAEPIMVEMPNGPTVILTGKPERIPDPDPTPEEVVVADTTPAAPATPPTITQDGPVRAMPTVTADSTDDELWTLLEMILDEPVSMSRQTLGVVNSWMDATRALIALKKG